MDRTTYKRLQILRGQAKLIRIQWAIIAILLVSLVLSFALRPARAIQTPVPAPAPVPEIVTMAPAPMIEQRPTVEDDVLPVERDVEPEPAEELVCLGRFRLTAYCPCKKCCGKDPSDPCYGITNSGTHAEQGHTIAVDPSVIPFGTEVVIDGHTYIAEDTGSGINEKCVDIFFDSHQEALNFGVQYADVYIKK